MKEITNKKVYQCEFCNRLSLSKGAMVVHEQCCKKNPKNWTPCASCEYLIKKYIEIENTRGKRCSGCEHNDEEYGCDYPDSKCNGSLQKTEFICEKTGKKMYYPRRVFLMSKEKREEIISRCDCAMPNECSLFKSYF